MAVYGSCYKTFFCLFEMFWSKRDWSIIHKLRIGANTFRWLTNERLQSNQFINIKLYSKWMRGKVGSIFCLCLSVCLCVSDSLSLFVLICILSIFLSFYSCMCVCVSCVWMWVFLSLCVSPFICVCICECACVCVCVCLCFNKLERVSRR